MLLFTDFLSFFLCAWVYQGLLDTEDEWIQKWSKSDRCLNGIAYDAVSCCECVGVRVHVLTAASTHCL